MNLTELSVAIGADLGNFDKGLNAAVSRVQLFAGEVNKAGASASTGFAGLANSVNTSAGRYIDSAGKMREANGRFVSSASLAAEAAKEFGGAAAGASNGFEKFASTSSQLQGLGAGLTLGLTTPIIATGLAAISAAGDMQALEKGFAATYKGAEPLSDALARVQELAKLPGLGLKEALQGATNLQAAGFSADLAARSLGAFGNALATVGRGKADLEGVQLALGQIASKGKISAEEIGQLAERVPQIRQAMQAAFGSSDTEVLQKAGINATEFVEGVTRELEKLPKVFGGINNASENFSDATTTALSKVGKSLNEAFNVEGLLNRASEVITSLANTFAGLPAPIQKTVFVFAGLAAAVGPVLLAIGSIGLAVPAVTAGLAALGSAFALVGTAASVAWVAITGPLAPIALGIAALVAVGVLLYKNWDEIKARALSLGKAMQDGLLAVLRPLQTGLAAVAIAAASMGFPAVASAAEAAAGGVGTLQGKVKDLELTAGNTRAEMESLRATFVGIGKQTFDPKLNFNPDAFLSLDSVAKLTGQSIGKLNGLLTDLEAKLKTAREAQVNATDEQSLLGINKTIQGLELQIKRLKELGQSSDEAAKALAKVYDSLGGIGQLNQALGGTVDVLGEKIKVLSSAIPNLLAAGFAPNSRVVQGFVTQLNGLEVEYAKFAARIAEKQQTLIESPISYNRIETPEIPVLAFDGSFAQQAQDAAAVYSAALASLTPAQEAATIALANFNTRAGEAVGQMNDIIASGLANAAASMAEGIANVLSGAAPISSLGGILLGTIGDILIQLGKMAIAVGITSEAIKKAFANPATAIIAGAAAIALGTLVKGAATKILSGGGGGGGAAASIGKIGTGASAPSSYKSPTPNPVRTEPAVQNNTQIIKLEVDGRELSKAVKVYTDRFGRIVGVN